MHRALDDVVDPPVQKTVCRHRKVVDKDDPGTDNAMKIDISLRYQLMIGSARAERCESDH
ncbi:hypothetical protein KL771_10500 [Hyphomicrobiaceae bacterium 22]|uniref:Uncharacterized protein n=1 Tax=Prosthecodimorpha staleyi TaxID=2840188 RepID=A0A947DA62_9HYPH|nr:hypothetical protein [Prosthecodimorpha staleyi]